jgi:flavin-dependent dehydrogenase
MALPSLQTEAWAQAVDATVKLGIAFEDFYQQGQRWLHPFLDAADIDRVQLGRALSDGRLASAPDQWAFATEHTWAGAKLAAGFIERSTWFERYRVAAHGGGGAFHIDALKYAALLKQEVLARENVQVLDATILQVRCDDRGAVSSILIDGGHTLCADLYIDCTGFAAILASAVQSPWVSVADRLLVDQAWVVQLPYIDQARQQLNLTHCHGLSAGWVFHIPLGSRIGTGYIHASRYIDLNEAKAELIAHLVRRWGYEARVIEPRLVRFKTGFRPHLWHQNVVAIGLSGFFCEPIESTAIALGHYAAMLLAEYLGAAHLAPDALRDRYNAEMREQHDDVLDFVQSHYLLSARTDSAFWREYGRMTRPESLKRVIKAFEGGGEALREDFAFRDLMQRRYGMFHGWSYMALLMGSGLRPIKLHPAHLT